MFYIKTTLNWSPTVIHPYYRDPFDTVLVPWLYVRSLRRFVSVLQIRIRMFLGLLDPDPLVRVTHPDPSIIKQK